MEFELRDNKDPTGKWLTKALFWELRHTEYRATFTLADKDREIDGVYYWSLKRLYLEKAHTPIVGEYEFVMDVIGSWDHWATLCNSYNLGRHIKLWRQELEVKMRSSMLKAMAVTATSEGSKGTAAAKYLADKGWEKHAGRPSKEDVERERKIAAGVRDNLEDDMARLGLTVVK